MPRRVRLRTATSDDVGKRQTEGEVTSAEQARFARETSIPGRKKGIPSGPVNPGMHRQCVILVFPTPLAVVEFGGQTRHADWPVELWKVSGGHAAHTVDWSALWYVPGAHAHSREMCVWKGRDKEARRGKGREEAGDGEEAGTC